METVAILCPGPSLARLTAQTFGSPDHVIAVNSAMSHPLACVADWWCAHDLWEPPLRLPDHPPKRGMVTCSAAIRDGQSRFVPYPLVDFRESRFAEAVRVTTSAAIYWAAELLARGQNGGEITMHGCDLKGTGHWDGEEEPNWTEDNWRLARACISKAMNAIPFPVWGINP